MASAASKVGNIRGPSPAAFVAVVMTDATTGLKAIAFPANLFTAAPVVVATGVSGDGRDVDVTLYGDPTATGCTILARKSRTLLTTIASLTALAGFDVFAPAAVKVHVMVLAST